MVTGSVGVGIVELALNGIGYYGCWTNCLAEQKLLGAERSLTVTYSTQIENWDLLMFRTMYVSGSHKKLVNPSN